MMRRDRTRTALGAGAALLAALASAGGARADAAAGKLKAQTCYACHGPAGHSGTGEVPSLAGQHAAFIETQLHLFRDGGRKDAQMAPMTVNLTDTDIADLGDFFAAQAPSEPSDAEDPAVAAKAKPLLARHNCLACHGPALAGADKIPRLAGQQRAYLDWQLRAYRDGKRDGIEPAMREAAKPLTNAEIRVIAAYVARLKEP